MTEQAIERDGMAVPRRYWAYGAIIITLVLAVMDASVANVALPTIAGDFHATPSQSIAIVSVYQLAIVILLLPLAALGDIYGYRRVYSAGVVVFTIASFCCAAAWSLDLLTAARILQGVGAAGIMSVNTALVRYIFPTAKLGHALGLNTLAVGIASSLGPSFAGLVLAVASWHWLFAVNVPLGIIAYVLGVKTLPDSRRTKQKFDIVTALLSAIMFSMLLGFITSFSHGGSWPRAVAELAIGLGAAFWAVRRQADRPAPLLPVDLLKIPVFALSMCASVCSFCAQMLAFVSLPFMLQRSLGFSPTMVGLLIVPWPLAVAVCAPIAGRLSDRVSSALLGFVGLLLLVAGLLLMAFLPAHASPANIAWRMVLCGAGFGTFQAPNNRLIVTSAPRIRSGAASGMLGTARLLGQALGAALVALILAHIAGPRGARISLLAGAAFAFIASFVSVARHGKNA
ncbi:MAG TPA: MFS transporter [Acidocella sp.]|uniref:MFS transporter n=1 Tax=Acidocella sp. TaxID=50710 RepID=UPI002B88EDB5|nr:MFS transporter [Acidocella sp.]HVE23644.1 MFS transporter [Acidocella sp.]